MKQLNIIHLGLGKVGTELYRQIQLQKPRLKEKFNLQLVYTGAMVSKGGVFNKQGLDFSDILKLSIRSQPLDIYKCLQQLSQPFALIDTTASDQTYNYILKTLKLGGYAVLSNKKPLTQNQGKYDQLVATGQNRLLYETTVGAGLPIIWTIKSFVETGDRILEIKSCFSGTLGFIFSKLEEGVLFSQAVKEAKTKGYTEPDPRDDLSGLDVARKTLIVARLIGQKLELSQIKTTTLHPEAMNQYSVDEFMDKLSDFDQAFTERIALARKDHKTLRYVATITPKKCTVGIETVSMESDLGALKGPDNIVQITTARNHQNQLIIKGPGAGVEVTAAGVFSDLLNIAGVV